MDETFEFQIIYVRGGRENKISITLRGLGLFLTVTL